MTAPFRFYGPPPITKRQMKAALDDFAELLSLDLELPAIAEAMHITQGSACAMLAMLCAKYGEQAR